MKEVIVSSLDYRKPAIPFALKMIVTFMVVTIVGISLWFYVGNETATTDQSNSWFAFLKSKSKDEHSKSAEEKTIPAPRQKSVVSADTSSVESHEAENINDTLQTEVQIPTANTDTIPVTTEDETIVVKQDQLLISTTINIEDKSEAVKEPEKTLSSEAVEHLNPAADLPEKEKAPATFITEFWVSPINYRGYKMSKNKLVLFGIEEPDAVKLYRVNDGIYMSYLKEYYKLNDTFDFVSYQKLKETEIPLAIK